MHSNQKNHPRCERPGNSEDATKGHTRFVLIDPQAEEVFVAGSFNDWNPGATPLINLGHGHWVKDLDLAPGRYEYQLVVDGRWMPDRNAKESVESPFEGVNSVVEVARPQFKPHYCALRKRIPRKWAPHYRALLKLRERLLEDCHEQITAAAEPLESHRMHMADCASDELDHALAISELTAEQNALYEVEQAIQRILDGTYGKCEQTGKRISAARLRAAPWVRFSAEVQERFERATHASNEKTTKEGK